MDAYCINNNQQIKMRGIPQKETLSAVIGLSW